MSVAQPHAAQPGARPDLTRDVTRGAHRLLRALGYSVLEEFPLPNGRRADLVALARDGSLRIVEVKSSLADFRSDDKWTHYLGFCDRFYFAIPLALPTGHFPGEAGLILADAHGAMMERESPARAIAAATRRSMLIRFGSLAADRLSNALAAR
ncbi:MmcB family DNA repair protein [Methylocystis heyeri]|uniref:MmcB family DNA repair protein n=1 Tax=Methylocystis heyeri TaxID=391905 RepID=A0A6B8KAK2_9HYPH|nr:MmcB family DNA repair protein [Methylocystis heyeri]QGM44215.1 MmcB family DNA repair protein [Methylocystis heyeri]